MYFLGLQYRKTEMELALLDTPLIQLGGGGGGGGGGAS